MPLTAKRKQQMKDYYQEHKQLLKTLNRIRLINNPDYNKEYYKKNKERISRQRKDKHKWEQLDLTKLSRRDKSKDLSLP